MRFRSGTVGAVFEKARTRAGAAFERHFKLIVARVEVVEKVARLLSRKEAGQSLLHTGMIIALT